MTAALDLALREHAHAVSQFRSVIARTKSAEWHRTPPRRAWSPAQETAHILLAYNFGTRAAQGTMAMQISRPAWKRAIARHILIPFLLNRARFPSGGIAPHEVDPLQQLQCAELVANQESALHALEQFADGTRDAFLHAVTTAPDRRIVHAYFGSLPLLTGWRLLSAHTRHHAP